MYARFKCYETDHLPVRIKSAIDDGYSITHKGLLCWAALPLVHLIPAVRLLFFVLEATFTYAFWAMKAKKKDYGMGHICFWDRTQLEYDGLCTHCALDEGVRGEFELSAEQLEVYAKEREEKRRAVHRDGYSSWHYRQMAENYDEYIGGANE